MALLGASLLLATNVHAESAANRALRTLSQAQGWLQLGRPELALPLLAALPNVPQTLPLRAWSWVLTHHPGEGARQPSRVR